jgi:hypothetical protein
VDLDRVEKRPGKELAAASTAQRRVPPCGDAFKSTATLVIPEFGFIASGDPKDVGGTPPERRWHGGSYVETPGKDAGLYHWSGKDGLTVTAY